MFCFPMKTLGFFKNARLVTVSVQFETTDKQEISLRRYTAQIKYISDFIICKLSVILSIFNNAIDWNIWHFDKFYCMVVRQQVQNSYEHSHYFSDKVETKRNELSKLWISIMCNLWRTIQKLCIKPFWAIVLMWVIHQCLHVDTNPWFIHKNKLIPVVTWKFKLLKTLIFSPFFHWTRNIRTNESVSEIL